MAKPPKNRGPKTKNQGVQPSLPHVPQRLEAPDEGTAATHAAELAGVGSLFMAAAAWLHSSEAKEATALAPLNNILALGFLLIGLGLYIPACRRIFMTLRGKRLWRYGLAGFALVTLGGSFGFTLSTYIWDTPFPTAIVEPALPRVLSSQPVVDMGKIARFNIVIINRGPGVARDVAWSSHGMVVRTPTSLAEENQFVNEIFDKLRLGPSRDLVPDNTTYNTFSKTFPDEDVTAIRNDEKRLYIMIRATWRDESGPHVSDSCYYLRPPGTTPVWRNCHSHNRVR